MKLQRNHLLLGAALLVTLALVVLAPETPDDAVVGSVATDREQAPDSASREPAAPTVAVAITAQAGESAAEIKDLFRSATWYQPPPPPPVAAAVAETPPEQIVPPMPFNYLGVFREDDTTIYILERANQILTVGQGDVIDDTYLFNILDDHTLSVTYLPLNAVQVLDTGPSL
jgi:hypothetical protein